VRASQPQRQTPRHNHHRNHRQISPSLTNRTGRDSQKLPRVIFSCGRPQTLKGALLGVIRSVSSPSARHSQCWVPAQMWLEGSCQVTYYLPRRTTSRRARWTCQLVVYNIPLRAVRSAHGAGPSVPTQPQRTHEYTIGWALARGQLGMWHARHRMGRKRGVYRRRRRMRAYAHAACACSPRSTVSLRMVRNVKTVRTLIMAGMARNLHDGWNVYIYRALQGVSSQGVC
jgi:hypothetical protein